MRRFVALLLHRRNVVLGVLILITLGFGAVLPRAIIATNFAELFFSRDEAFDRYLERMHAMTNDHGLIVGVEEPEPFSPAALDRLSRAATTIEDLAEVRNVMSLLDAGRIIDDEDEGLLFPKYADEAREHPERAGEILQRVMADPVWSRMVISEDGRHTAMVIEAVPDEKRQAEAEQELVARIYELLEAAGYDRDQVHMGGTSAVTAEMFHQIHRNLTMIFPVVVLALFLVGYLMFRQLWPVLVTLLVAFIAVIWTSGFALLLDPKVNLFLSVVPVIILVISFSDVIHLCSAYLLELGTGKEKHEAILATGADVGAACFFTSATTFIGFTALAFVPSPVMRQFGLVLGFGVGATLLIALTLVPVIFDLMRTPPAPPRATTNRKDLLSRLLDVSERISIERPRAVVAVSLLIVAASAFGLSRLSIDASLLERLSPQNRVRQDARYLAENFAGTSTLSVFLESTDDGDLLDADRFAAIAALEAKIAVLPQVTQVMSLLDLIRMMHVEMREPGDTTALPQTRPQLFDYILLLELADGEALQRSLSPNRRTMQFVLRLNTSSFRESFALGEEIRRIGSETMGAGVAVESGGLLFFFGRWLDELVEGQKNGLLFSILTITLMMIIGLKSLRTGLWSMAPNMLPLLVLGGVLGALWDKADSDSLVVAMIAIGIGVDDTIHFLMRYRIESERWRDSAIAIRETFHFAGRAIVITSVILVIGFLPLNISDYATFILLGTLLPMTLVVALLANLFVVPALARLGWIRYRFPQEKPAERELQV